MSVTFDQAKAHINVPDTDPVDDDKLTLYVDAANSWVDSKVTDTTPDYVTLGTLFLIKHWWSLSQLGPATGVVVDEYVSIGGVSFGVPRSIAEILGVSLPRASAVGSFPDAVSWVDPVERPA